MVLRAWQCCRCTNESGRCSQLFTHQANAPNHLCNIRSKDTAISMYLIKNNELEVFEERSPIPRVRFHVWQYLKMHRVRIGKDNPRVFFHIALKLIFGFAFVFPDGNGFRANAYRKSKSFGLNFLFA